MAVFILRFPFHHTAPASRVALLAALFAAMGLTSGCPAPKPSPNGEVTLPDVAPVDEGRPAPPVTDKIGQLVRTDAGAVLTSANGTELTMAPGALTADAVVAIYTYELSEKMQSEGIVAAFQLAIPSAEATLAQPVSISIPLARWLEPGTVIPLCLLDYANDLGVSADAGLAGAALLTWAGDATVNESGSAASATLIASNRRYVLRADPPARGDPMGKTRTRLREEHWDLPSLEDADPGSEGPLGLVLIHGGFGDQDQKSADVWDNFTNWVRESDGLRNEFHIFVYAYDSSEGLAQNASDLHAQIEALPAAKRARFDRFAIVAHSRGGLVARALMHNTVNRRNGRLYREAIVRVITLGTPHHGSPFACPPWARYSLHGGYEQTWLPTDPLFCAFHPVQCADAISYEWALAKNWFLWPDALYWVGYEPRVLGFSAGWLPIVPVYHDTAGGRRLAWDDADRAIPFVTVYDSQSVMLRYRKSDGTIIELNPPKTDISPTEPPSMWSAVLAARELAAADSEAMRAKYVCYAGYFQQPASFDAWLQARGYSDPHDLPDALRGLVSEPADSRNHILMMLTNIELALFAAQDGSYPYLANDGFVPVTSALYLADARSLSLHEVADWAAAPGGIPDAGDSYVLRRRLFPGFDHLDLAADERVFPWIAEDLNEAVQQVEPGTPSNPGPPDGAQNVSVEADLDWADAPHATSYDVRFGTTNPPPLVDEDVRVSNWPLATMAYGTTFYWQVVARNSSGSVSGPVWRFATESALSQNQAPIAQEQSVVVRPGIPQSIALAASDPDDGPSPLEYSIVAGPSHGTLSGTPPAVQYSPEIGYEGFDQFVFRAYDGADSDDAEVSIAVAGVVVPWDAPTLRAAIDAADSGQLIVVLNGTYSGADNRNLSFSGKDLILKAASGPDACVIDCEAQGRAFGFSSSESAAAIIEGFTIQNASSSALFISDSSPTIRDCVFLDNNAGDGYGGAAHISHASPEFQNCRFVANSAYFGGAVYATGQTAATSPRFINCSFFGNSANTATMWSRHGTCHVTVINCTFAYNSTHYSPGGIYVQHEAGLTVRNSILYHNDGVEISTWYATATVSDSCVEGGSGASVITDVPAFVDGAGGNLRLSSVSPCVNRGNNAYVPPWAVTDLDGSQRIQSGIVDMGAYESPY